MAEFCDKASIVYSAEFTADGVDCTNVGVIGEAGVIATREFFQKMSKYGKDQSGYDTGFQVNGTTICIT